MKNSFRRSTRLFLLVGVFFSVFSIPARAIPYSCFPIYEKLAKWDGYPASITNANQGPPLVSLGEIADRAAAVPADEHEALFLEEVDRPVPELLSSSPQRPRQYELQLAADAGLSVEEVMGVTRNFHPGLVTTGETGVYRINGELETRADKNLIGAYSKYRDSCATGEVTVDLIEQIRRAALSERITGKKTGKITLDKAKRREPDFTREIPIPNVNAEVLQQLKGFGYQVDYDGKVLKIRQPEEAVQRALENYVETLNKMVKGRTLPEVIASYAVQQLLLIHPWRDGNGRTARLIGQMIYHQLAGKTFLFPEAFHREMEYSAWQLARILSFRKMVSKVSSPSKASPSDLHVDNSPTLEDVLLQISSYGVIPEIANVGHANRNRRDTPFGHFYYKGDHPGENSIGQSYTYDQVPERAKHLPPGQDSLYYGRGAKSQEEAIAIIDRMFRNGRKAEGESSFDLNRHENGFNHERLALHYGEDGIKKTGFFQTTEIFKEGFLFSRKIGKLYGIVFIIDPGGAETLSIPRFSEDVMGRDSKYSNEHEVVFYKTIAPQHFRAAIIYDHRTNKPIRFLWNPNYRP